MRTNQLHRAFAWWSDSIKSIRNRFCRLYTTTRRPFVLHRHLDLENFVSKGHLCSLLILNVPMILWGWQLDQDSTEGTRSLRNRTPGLRGAVMFSFLTPISSTFAETQVFYVYRGVDCSWIHYPGVKNMTEKKRPSTWLFSLCTALTGSLWTFSKMRDWRLSFHSSFSNWE